MALTTRRGFSARSLEWHWLVRYSLAVVLYGAILGIGLLNSRYDVKLNLTIPIVFALVATVWFLGRGTGILMSILFEATTIFYAPAPVDGNYPKAWFGYLSVFLLYIFLVMVIGGLQKAGYTIAAQRDLLQVTLSSIGDGVIATDTEGRVTFMNGVAETMTGWHASEARGQLLADVAKILNEASREQVRNPVEKVLETGRTVGLANHSVLVSRDGRETPIEDSAAPIRDGDAVRGVIFVVSDATERKLAERARRETEIMHCIVEAQEGERNRIARGLHDQLGQQMTALRLKVESLAEKYAEDDHMNTALAEVKHSAVELDRDIGFLSWELKPTELDDLGLQNALSSFVREWSLRHGIRAEFESGLAPGSEIELSHTVSTNVYRIVQEALHNVLRHAGATNVSVLLQRRGGDLVLIVEDNGKGFERADSSARHRGGIGLTGMQERAALLGGSLDVETSPGEGTAVIVRIPLSSESNVRKAVTI